MSTDVNDNGSEGSNPQPEAEQGETNVRFTNRRCNGDNGDDEVDSAVRFAEGIEELGCKKRTWYHMVTSHILL